MMTAVLSSSLLATGESLVLLCFVLIANLILIYGLCYVCSNWVDYSFQGDKRQRLVNQVLGNMVHLHHLGVVTLPGNGRGSSPLHGSTTGLLWMDATWMP
jgi:hypothetical protein